MQLAASAIFLQIFQSDILTSSVFSQHMLPIMLTALDNKDNDIGEAWLEALLEVIPALSKEVLRKEVCPLSLDVSVSSLPAVCKPIKYKKCCTCVVLAPPPSC